jgi:hypothetical protein
MPKYCLNWILKIAANISCQNNVLNASERVYGPNSAYVYFLGLFALLEHIKRSSLGHFYCDADCNSGNQREK